MTAPFRTHAFGNTSSTLAAQTGFAKSLAERIQSSRQVDGTPTVAQAFTSFLEVLEPTDGERHSASQQQTRLRERLEQHVTLKATYLSGSYRRRTLVRPLDDIDLLVVLDHEALGITTDAYGTSAALDLVRRALDAAYPRSEKIRCEHCIQMQFAGTGIGFDVVPVLQFTEHEFWMPDESRGTWIRINPREVQRLVSLSNQGHCDGWLVPLVKLLKAWKDQQKVPLSGFHLEAMAYYALCSAPSDERRGLAFLFAQLSAAVWNPTPDIWIQGENADAGLTTTNRTKAARMLMEAASAAQQAVVAENEGRTEDAHSIWYSLFGDRYPESGKSVSTATRLSAAEAQRAVRSRSRLSATSSGLIAAAPGYVSVASSTDHGGRSDEADNAFAPTISHDISAEQRARLEDEISMALRQFSGLSRMSPAAAAADPKLWPVTQSDHGKLYAVLAGDQETNFGTRHRILVKIPIDMPATEPRVYMLRQHVDGIPRKGGTIGVRFVASRPIRHQWRDGAMCSHSRRDRWDGRLVTVLVHAADWLFRQEHYRRTGSWIGYEIDQRGRLLKNGQRVPVRRRRNRETVRDEAPDGRVR